MVQAAGRLRHYRLESRESGSLSVWGALCAISLNFHIHMHIMCARSSQLVVLNSLHCESIICFFYFVCAAPWRATRKRVVLCV